MHGGWVLSPSFNANNFISNINNPPPEDPLDEEQVNWGDDDEHE